MIKVSITNYSSAHQSAIRRILERIGWAEQYIVAAERNAEAFSHDQSVFGVFLAVIGSSVVGFLYVQFHEWNQLAQIEGLAVDPNYHRQGIASEHRNPALSLCCGPLSQAQQSLSQIH